MASLIDLSSLPADPGCYLFKDKTGTIIYVGKAKNLHKRVSSYFQKKDHDPKTSLLVSDIVHVDTIVTKTEMEALLLENNLIKKHYPKYNLDLKDSRRYAYLRITDHEPLPWIETARTRESKGSYYGPFVSGTYRKIVFDVITRQFKLLAKKPSPRTAKLIDPLAYAQRVAQAKEILKGNVDALIQSLAQAMSQASKTNNYEYALILRRQIEALRVLKEKQQVERANRFDTHVINYLVLENEAYLMLFGLRKGALDEKIPFQFPYREEFIEEFLVQYYDAHPVPREIILPVPVDPVIQTYLETKAGHPVSISVPQKGDKKELLDLVSHNIKTTFFAGIDRIEALKSVLSLSKLPQVIECFDISHLGGTNTVASMVRFTRGLPDKKNYRKFKIRFASEGDDFRAMREVVYRRYGKSLRETMSLPDLIVIDGGTPQLTAACLALRELKLNLPIIALAKKFEEIYRPGQSEPLRIDQKNKGLLLLRAIRDEAHRFALSYQRSLRTNTLNRLPNQKINDG